MATENSAKKLGRFDVFEKIGEGGFGTVYRGFDPMWEKPVAIKILHKDISRLPNAVERFRKEAKVAADLRHPNIVGVTEVGEHEADYYLVMDYISGGTLAQKMEEKKLFALTEVVEWLSPIADALDYAHTRKKMIHRDIKPSNILVGEDRQIYLSDFGLTKLTEDPTTTTTGVVLGTYEYMAPEQVTGKELTPAADLYALGVIAYQMMTGRAPFTSATNSPFEIQDGHVHHDPPDPRSLRAEISPEVSRVLLKILAKDPAQRYASGKEFIGALHTAVEQFNREKTTELQQVAEQAAKKYEFSSAIAALQEIESIAPSKKSQQQIADYQVKASHLEVYKRHSEEVKRAQEQLDAYKASLPWFRTEDAQPSSPNEYVSETSDSPTSDLNEYINKKLGSQMWLGWVMMLFAVFFFQISNAWPEFPGTFWYPAGLWVIFAVYTSTFFQSSWWITGAGLAVGVIMSLASWGNYQDFYDAVRRTYPGFAVQALFFVVSVGVTLARVWYIKQLKE